MELKCVFSNSLLTLRDLSKKKKDELELAAVITDIHESCGNRRYIINVPLGIYPQFNGTPSYGSQ